MPAALTATKLLRFQVQLRQHARKMHLNILRPALVTRSRGDKLTQFEPSTVNAASHQSGPRGLRDRRGRTRLS